MEFKFIQLFCKHDDEDMAYLYLLKYDKEVIRRLLKLSPCIGEVSTYVFTSKEDLILALDLFYKPFYDSGTILIDALDLDLHYSKLDDLISDNSDIFWKPMCDLTSGKIEDFIYMRNRNDQIIITKNYYDDDYEEFKFRFNGKTLSFCAASDSPEDNSFSDVYEIPDMIIAAFELGQQNPDAFISVVETEKLI